MSYHSATLHMTDSRNEERFLWEIGTSYYKGATPHKSAAYTDKSEGYRIIRWVSNDAVIPNDIMEKLTWPHKDAMKHVRAKQTQAAIDNYIQSQANRTPEEIVEDEFGMRAAFGEGTEVINLFTRERTTL